MRHQHSLAADLTSFVLDVIFFVDMVLQAGFIMYPQEQKAVTAQIIYVTNRAQIFKNCTCALVRTRCRCARPQLSTGLLLYFRHGHVANNSRDGCRARGSVVKTWTRTDLQT